MNHVRTSYITKIGMLSAIALILMFFEVPVPMMPNFLQLDASELPAILGAFLLGPMAGVFIELIKNMLHATNTHTMGIGEMANFLVGISFVVPAGYLYGKYSSRLGALLALSAGTVTMMIVAGGLNYFVLIPLYQMVLHFPLEQMIALGTVANPRIVDLSSFITMAIAPFNVLKGAIVSLLTMMIYKKVFILLGEG